MDNKAACSAKGAAGTKRICRYLLTAVDKCGSCGMICRKIK
jgi:hypothetical protein